MRALGRGSGPARLLGFRVRTPTWVWMSVSYECCVLSSTDLCVGLITRPEESWVWCVWVWLWNLDNETAAVHLGLLRRGKNGISKTLRTSVRKKQFSDLKTGPSKHETAVLTSPPGMIYSINTLSLKILMLYNLQSRLSADSSRLRASSSGMLYEQPIESSPITSNHELSDRNCLWNVGYEFHSHHQNKRHYH